jgi:hypothetical protein
VNNKGLNSVVDDLDNTDFRQSLNLQSDGSMELPYNDGYQSNATSNNRNKEFSFN